MLLNILSCQVDIFEYSKPELRNSYLNLQLINELFKMPKLTRTFSIILLVFIAIFDFHLVLDILAQFIFILFFIRREVALIIIGLIISTDNTGSFFI